MSIMLIRIKFQMVKLLSLHGASSKRLEYILLLNCGTESGHKTTLSNDN